MAGKWPNDHKICQKLPLQDPSKFTQIAIFVLKICHLATVASTSTLAQPQGLSTKKKFSSKPFRPGGLNMNGLTSQAGAHKMEKREDGIFCNRHKQEK
jgi:hypothetical protein